MSYLGNTPTTQAFSPAVDVFSGNGSTTAFTLSRPVASVAQVEAVIENVVQSPVDAFTVSGNTITFTSAPPSGSSNIYVKYTSPITQVMQPTDGSVTNSKLAALAVTSDKIAAGQVFGLNGVAFPASQVASADANTLDDYEEGTWTPVFAGTTTAGSATYQVQVGNYIKVGRLVVASFDIQAASGLTGGAGNLWLKGLPFVVGSFTGISGGSCAVGYYAAFSGTWAQISGYLDSGQSQVNVMYATAAQTSYVTVSAVQNNMRIAGTVTYITP